MKKLITIIALAGVNTSFAQLTNIINFDGVVDGKNPIGHVIKEGNFLYGMTSEGGSNDLGIIYKVMADGTGYQKLLDFNGSANGSTPLGSLVSDGTNLYGMTSAGGTNNLGTIFSISTSGSYNKLFDFDGTTNGSNPLYALHMNGTFLYGMTQYGGANGIGTIFKIMPNGTGYAKLHDFNGSDGNAPIGGLISDATHLYGTTESGGTNNHGVIFKIMPNGTGFQKIHDFNQTTSGRFPRGNPILVGGNLYGLTQAGGSNNTGALYKVSLTGTDMTKLIDFTGFANGSQPEGALMHDGTIFYGSTSQGGANFGGTLFKYAASGSSANVEANLTSEITLFPNPSSDFVIVSGENLDQFSQMTVYSVEGKVVASKPILLKTEMVSTINWSKGIYFVVLSNGEKNKMIKFQKI